MEVQEFFKRLAERCAKVPQTEYGSRCEQCGMRIFCFTAPQSITEDMVRQVVNYLQNDEHE